jgi:hypothetical protein
MEHNTRSILFFMNWNHKSLQYLMPIMMVVLCILMLISISACGSGEEATSIPDEVFQGEEQSDIEPENAADKETSDSRTSESDEILVETEEASGGEIDVSDPQVIQSSWEGSPHADTFILDEQGNNNTCARCHSPMVWLPSMDDVPESCLVCKFELSDPPPLIPESEWVMVECNICHKVDKKGNVEPEYAWLEIAQIEEYAEVESTTELCQKCHTEVELSGHAVPHLGGAHANYECTDCHDAHGTLASCTAVGCHDDVIDSATPIPGHDEDHELVSCVACHDAGELEVDLDEELGIWTTFVTDSFGEWEKIPLISHNTILQAPCERCHYADNPWNLSTQH